MKYIRVARALYDYVAPTLEEISFIENDTLYIISETEPDWWEAQVKGGGKGLIPSNYVVEVVNSLKSVLDSNLSIFKLLQFQQLHFKAFLVLSSLQKISILIQSCLLPLSSQSSFYSYCSFVFFLYEKSCEVLSLMAQLTQFADISFLSRPLESVPFPLP